MVRSYCQLAAEVPSPGTQLSSELVVVSGTNDVSLLRLFLEEFNLPANIALVQRLSGFLEVPLWTLFQIPL